MKGIIKQMPHKFQITSFSSDDSTMTVEVLDGTKVVLTKEFPITYSLELSDVKTKLAKEIALMEEKDNAKVGLKKKVDDLKKDIGKLTDLK